MIDGLNFDPFDDSDDVLAFNQEVLNKEYYNSIDYELLCEELELMDLEDRMEYLFEGDLYIVE